MDGLARKSSWASYETGTRSRCDGREEGEAEQGGRGPEISRES